MFFSTLLKSDEFSFTKVQDVVTNRSGIFPNTRSNAYQSKPNSSKVLRMAVMFKIRARPLPSIMPSRVLS
jgi:hypothetical protein